MTTVIKSNRQAEGRGQRFTHFNLLKAPQLPLHSSTSVTAEANLSEHTHTHTLFTRQNCQNLFWDHYFRLNFV